MTDNTAPYLGYGDCTVKHNVCSRSSLKRQRRVLTWLIRVLHHAVRLRLSRFDHTVFNPMRQAFLSEGVAATGRALLCLREVARE